MIHARIRHHVAAALVGLSVAASPTAAQSDSKEAARAKVRAARNHDPQAKLAAARFPAPVTVNPAWDKMFRDQFQKFFPGHTLLGQSLYSRDWYIKRHPVTDTIEYRQIGTYFAVRTPDDGCMIVALDLYEPFIGGRFQQGRFEDGFKRDPILCENI